MDVFIIWLLLVGGRFCRTTLATPVDCQVVAVALWFPVFLASFSVDVMPFGSYPLPRYGLLQTVVYRTKLPHLKHSTVEVHCRFLDSYSIYQNVAESSRYTGKQSQHVGIASSKIFVGNVTCTENHIVKASFLSATCANSQFSLSHRSR